MKLKISEIFEDASIDINAVQLRADTDIDRKKIRELTMNKINCRSKKGKISFRLILAAAIVTAVMVSALAANAASGGKLFGALLLNNENRYLAGQKQYAVAKEASESEENVKFERIVPESSIINKEQLESLNAGTVTNIEVTKKGEEFVIPEILTNNGDMVIFTGENGKAWHLKKGDELTLEYRLDLKTNSQSDPKGEFMEVGIIKDGVPIKGFVRKAKEFSYVIKAEEEGDYYFYAENYSAGYIIIASGSIK